MSKYYYQIILLNVMSLTSEQSQLSNDLAAKCVQSVLIDKKWNLDCLEDTPDIIEEMLNCVCGECCSCNKRSDLTTLYEKYILHTKTIRKTKNYSHCLKIEHLLENVDCENCALECAVSEIIMEYEEFKTTFRCQHFKKTIVEQLSKKFNVKDEPSPIVKSSVNHVTSPQKIYFVSIENCNIEFVVTGKKFFYHLKIYVDPDLNKELIIPDSFDLSITHDQWHFEYLKMFSGKDSLEKMINFIDNYID